MKKLICALLVLATAAPALAGLNSKKALYIGGTVGLPEQTEGTLVTSDAAALEFIYGQNRLSIPYKSITELEYGQKAGRRVAVAILVSPVALFSKKRKHYLTVTYKDAAAQDQAAVFELGKEIVRTTLAVVETRSGKQIQYQDEEARKSGRG